MFITQISVYLENSRGTLRSLTKILADKGINLLAMSVADTAHFGIIRIVVREAEADLAIQTLRENGFVAKTNHVFCVAVPNQPAGLDRVLEVIEKNNISVEYMYSLNCIIGSNALLVLRLSAEGMDKDAIADVLCKNDVKLIKQDEINLL